MIKKIISLFLVIIMTVSFFCACSRDKSIVLFVAVEKTASSFDPQIAKGDTTRIIVRNCFEGLVSRREDGSVGNGVADSWDVSENGLTYTFHLRKDAVWHLTSNAKEQLEGKIPEDFAPHVTASDFVFALRRAVDPSNKSTDAYMFMNIAGAQDIYQKKIPPTSLGVKALSDTELQIKLARKQSNFIEMLLSPAAMPCNETFFNACMGRYGTYIKFLLSNGPFYLSRFDDSSYRINKNPDYVGEHTPKADAVWLYCTPDREKLMNDIKDDDYSFVRISEAEYPAFASSKSKTIISSENIIRSLIFNIADSQLSCPDLRRAFAAATNASLVADNAGKEYYGGFVPRCAAFKDVTEHPVMYNENNAVKYLGQAFKQLDISNISLNILCEKQYEELMRKMLQEWQRILGVNVALSVVPVTEAELDTALSKGEYQIAFCPLKSDAASAYEYFGNYTPSKNSSVTGYANASVTSMLTELYSGGDKKAQTVYSELEQKLADVSFMIPVWTEKTYFVSTKDVSGAIVGDNTDMLYLYNATNRKG